MSALSDPRDDRTLVERLASGERAALAPLVERHQGSVLRFARTLVRDEATAEDVLQETFLAVMRGAGTFRGDGSVRAWLLTIARHEASRRRRRDGVVEPDDDVERLGVEAGWGCEDGPERALEGAEVRARVIDALARLDEADREILALRDMEGLDGPETARALGIGLAAMKSRLHRARLRFAAALRTLEGGTS